MNPETRSTTPNTNSSQSVSAVIACTAACLFFTLSFFSRIRQPVGADELNWLVAATDQIKIGFPTLFLAPHIAVVCSPHLYLSLLTFSFHIFGPSEAAAHLIGFLSGVACLIMTAFISHQLVKKITPSPNSLLVLLPSVLLATTPAFIQGAMILDIDNTVMIPGILFLIYLFYELKNDRPLTYFLLLACTTAVTLWMRITTPPLVCAASLLFLYTDPRLNIGTKLKATVSVMFGVLLFIATWYSYTLVKHFNFYSPFEYTLSVFSVRTQSSGGFHAATFLQSMVQILLWFGLFPCILFAHAVIKRGLEFFRHRTLTREDIFLAVGVFLVGGYTFVGGTPFGFPKYQLPGLPLLLIYLCFFLPGRSKVTVSSISLITVLSLLVQYFILGDLLYLVRFELRDLASLGLSGGALLKGHLVQITAGLVGYFLIFILGHKRKLGLAVTALFIGLGSNLGVDLQQNFGGYQTGYSYGTRGARETGAFLKSHVRPDARIIVPHEIIYYTDLPQHVYIHDRVWNNPEALLTDLRDPKDEAFVYSLAFNTLHQIKAYEADNPLHAFLLSNFDRTQIGSYTIWLKKHHP